MGGGGGGVGWEGGVGAWIAVEVFKHIPIVVCVCYHSALETKPKSTFLTYCVQK